MKNFKTILFILFCLSALLFTACTKDDETETERKERLTNTFNAEICADSLKRVVIWLQEMGTRFALADNHRDVAEKIRVRFIRLGYSDCRLDSFFIIKSYKNVEFQQWQYNVVATLKGSRYPDSISIVGAHYDNNLSAGDPFLNVPGANDNASGVAAAIELARVMKKYKYSPSNSIEFIAFGAEEIGLYGSSNYAYNAKVNSEKIKMMLNNDMISYQPSTNRSDWVVNLVDYENSHILRQKAEQLCERYTSLKYINVNTYNRQSDSYPFAVNNYKALFFISASTDPYYHTLTDTYEKYNFEFSREIVKLCCAMLVGNN